MRGPHAREVVPAALFALVSAAGAVLLFLSGEHPEGTNDLVEWCVTAAPAVLLRAEVWCSGE